MLNSMAAIEQTTIEGEFRCAVGRDGAKMATIQRGMGSISFPVYTGKIFRATRRKDGVLTWRLWGKYGGSRSGHHPSARFLNYLEATAPHAWGECRHNQVCV
jgi:hypothetical protein